MKNIQTFESFSYDDSRFKNLTKEKIKTNLLTMNINDKNLYGDTMLTRTVVDNNLALVKYLLKLGADVDHTDDNDMLPISLAVDFVHTEIVEELLKYSPMLYWDNNKSSIVGTDEYNIIQISLLRKSYKIFEMLISYFDFNNIFDDVLYDAIDVDDTEILNYLRKDYYDDVERYIKKNKANRFNL